MYIGFMRLQMNLALDAFVKHMEEAASTSCSVSGAEMAQSFELAQQLYEQSLKLVTTAQVIDMLLIGSRAELSAAGRPFKQTYPSSRNCHAAILPD